MPAFEKIAQITFPIIVFDYFQNPRPNRATFFSILVNNKSTSHVGSNSNNMDPFFTPLFLSLPTSTSYKNPGAHIPLSKQSHLHHLLCSYCNTISSRLGYSRRLLTRPPATAVKTPDSLPTASQSNTQDADHIMSLLCPNTVMTHLMESRSQSLQCPKGFITLAQTFSDPEYPS